MNENFRTKKFRTKNFGRKSFGQLFLSEKKNFRTVFVGIKIFELLFFKRILSNGEVYTLFNKNTLGFPVETMYTSKANQILGSI